MEHEATHPFSFRELTGVFPAGVSFAGMCGGIVAGKAGCGQSVAVCVASVAAVIAIGLKWMSRRGGNGSRRLMGNLYPLSAAAIFFAIGLGAWLLLSPPGKLPSTGNYAFAMGRVRDFRTTSSGDVAEVDVVGFKGSDYVTGRVNAPLKVLLDTEGENLRRGEIILFRNMLTPISADTPDSYGYVRSLYCRGVAWRQKIPSGGILSVGYDPTLSDRASDLRDAIVRHIDATQLSESTRSFLAALLLGDRESLDGELYESMSAAGIGHFLALSGLHLGMVVMMLSLLLWPLRRLVGRRMRWVTVLTGVWVFVVLTGMSVSVVRAAVMTSVFIVSVCVERSRTGLNTLGFAGCVILLSDPVALFSAGFQMSFLICLVLILLGEYLDDISERMFDRRLGLLMSGWAWEHPKLFEWRIRMDNGILKVAGVCLVSLTAFGAGWVLTGYYFGRVSLMFLPANVAAGVLVWLIFVSGYVYLPLWGIGLAPPLLGRGLDRLCELLEAGVEMPAVSEWGVSRVFIPWEVVALYLGALLLMEVWRVTRKRGWLLTAVVTAAAALTVAAVREPEIAGEGLRIGVSKGEARILSAALTGNREMSYPRGVVSRTSTSCGEIVIADCDGPQETAGKSGGGCRVLIVGGGCEKNVENWVEMFAPEIVAVVSPGRCEGMEKLESMERSGQIRLRNLKEVNLYVAYRGEEKE